MQKPGVGWAWVMIGYLSLGGFLYGAHKAPRDSELLKIEQQLQRGELPDARQRELLFKSLEKHPQWHMAWQGQHSHFLGSPWPEQQTASQVLLWRAEKKPLRLTLSPFKNAITLQIKGYGDNSTWEDKVSVSKTILLPAPQKVPELIYISGDYQLHWKML